MARGYDDYDDRDDYDRPGPRRESFPGTVTAAGIIWILYGSLQLLGSGIQLIGVLGAMGRAPGANITGAMCGTGLGLLIGVAFLVVGIQSVNGSARDTLGNAIGSFGIAALAIIGGIFVIAQTRGAMGVPFARGVIGIIAIIVFVIAGGLILAGILALAGRDQYRRWKMAQQPRRRPPPRRRDDYYDDEYDD